MNNGSRISNHDRYHAEARHHAAYRSLLADNPHLQEKRFEKIFCYQVDETTKKLETMNF